MLNRRVAALVAFGLLGMIRAAGAADQEGCLFCHRLELANPGATVSDLRVTESNRALHAGLYCSDCHPDAKMTPHAVAPGAARCIDECHSVGTGSVPETHRRAAFGGLTESHRHTAMPDSPCLLCHKADDPPSSSHPASTRCRACHPGQDLSVAQGVHGRVLGKASAGGCVACHPPHPATATGGTAEKGPTCSKAGCHGVVTENMKVLGKHGKGDVSERPDRRSGFLLFGVVAALGLLPGRLSCRNRSIVKGEAR
jgi:hypothetical protein